MDYWVELIECAAGSCNAALTDEQIQILARAAKLGHDEYNMLGGYSSQNMKNNELDRKWENKFIELQAEYDKFKDSTECALKQYWKIPSKSKLSIEDNGNVFITTV